MANRVEELFNKEEIKQIIKKEQKVEEELEEMTKEFKNEDDADEEFKIDKDIATFILGELAGEFDED